MESIKKMLENQRDCADVLIQLAAVRAEINNTGKLLLKEHIAEYFQGRNFRFVDVLDVLACD